MAERFAWDQLPDEDDLWFDRFEMYRQLGAIRSVTKTYQVAKREDPERIAGNNPGHNWYEKVEKFRWADRARAWDKHERDRFRAEEQNINDDKRRARLQLIGELQGEAFVALKNANIAEMEELQARIALPQLRLLFLGLLAAERAEYGGEAVVDGENQDSVIGDELAKNIAKAWGKPDESP